MLLIREVVHQILAKGYLTVADENQLRELLSTKYGSEDLKALRNCHLR